MGAADISPETTPEVTKQAASPTFSAHEAWRSLLETAQQQLLDLSLRNRALHYRSLARRGLWLEHPDAYALYSELVRKKRTLRLCASALEPLEPRAIACPYSPEQLQRRLLTSYRLARRWQREQGVNSLYLTLGMLQWYDSDTASPYLAPLLFVPVQLQRAARGTRYALEPTGEALRFNPSLELKLQTLGVRLPELPLRFADRAVWQDYCEALAQALAEFPTWQLIWQRFTLDFFSFSKLSMYHDLKPEHWPLEQQAPWLRAWVEADGYGNSPVNSHANGHMNSPMTRSSVTSPASPISSRPQVTQATEPATESATPAPVFPADSSQLQALHAVAQGRSLLIQGPPGTGKSQTISNIIAQAVSRGQSVLFVAEKFAAVDVVQRKMQSAGLGMLCLEMHSAASSKRSVLEQLATRLEPRSPVPLPVLEPADSQMLEAYGAALQHVLGRSGLSVFTLYGLLLDSPAELNAHSAPLLSDALFSDCADWTPQDLQQRRDALIALEQHCARDGLPQQHPLWPSACLQQQPSDSLTQLCQQALQQHRQLETLSQTTWHSLQAYPLGHVASVQQLSQLLLHVYDAPPLQGVCLALQPWQQHHSELEQLLAAGQQQQDLQQRYRDRLSSQAWQQPLETLEQVRRDLAQQGKQWWRFASARYRQAHSQLAAWCLDSPPESLAAKLALLDALLEVARLRQWLDAPQPQAQQCFGSLWQGSASSWPLLQRVWQWFAGLQQQLYQEPWLPALLTLLHKQPQLHSRAQALQQALQHYQQTLQALAQLLQLPAEWLADFQQQDWQQQRQKLEHWQQHSDSWPSLLRFNRLQQRLQALGLAACSSALLAFPADAPAPVGLAAAFQQRYYQQLLAVALQRYPVLAAFSSTTYQQQRQRYCQQAQQQFQQRRSALQHSQQQRLQPLQQASQQQALPRRKPSLEPAPSAAAALPLLRHEIHKKRLHLPIRQLMMSAAPLLQQLSPVFMMSPLSLATFLPSAAPRFDLLVVDEASQLRPADALGAMLRARQVVIVGDSKQLPPSRFFEGDWEDEDSDLPRSPAQQQAADALQHESILSLLAAQGWPQQLLRWHYRSYHESLIHVSNQRVYEGQLKVFPSAQRQGVGLHWQHLPDTIYEAGGSRSNPQEAQAVAEAVMVHARQYPEHSLAVAAFSQAQAEAIEDALDALRRLEPSQESFFEAHPHEPFVIKNLETLQGDERDVVLVSVGYGRQADGSLRYSFGPLNQADGWRRLNVLITRARRRCVLYSNLCASDIDLRRSSARAVADLQYLLAYAEQQQHDPPTGTARHPLSRYVSRLLQRWGYRCHYDLGEAESRIDIAIAHPEQPERYLAGLLSDGMGYACSPAAYDRECLRPEQLRLRGWQLYTLWSPAWYEDPEHEAARLHDWLEQLPS